MDQVLPSQTSSSGLLEPESEELQFRVDSFRKLGYSSEEVRSALRKLGLGTDTNSVLGELVRSRTSTASSSDGDEKRPGPKDPLLPPSWVHGSRLAPQTGHQKNMDAELRPVVIDGSNVAMSHGNKEVFSCRGIHLAVNYFLDRGHSTITVFVPTWRKEQPRPDAPITDQHILMELEKRKIVVFTPSRRVGGKRVVCYDDRFIVKLAYESNGVIVSNDTYRDLQGERPEWKKCIEERLLMYSFVNDKFMPPDDPLGRHGPSLDNFLRKKPLLTEQKRQLCPYDKKCTYGIKCKFYHPERTNQSYLSLADELREKAQISTSKEEKNPRSSPRQVDTGSAHNTSSHPRDTKADLSGDGQSSSYPSRISGNQMLYREDPRNSSHHTPLGVPSVPNHYYGNVSHEYLDSGFSSFESQYSDPSHCPGNSLRPMSQQQAVHLGNNNSSHSCRCCSHTAPSTAHHQQHRNLDSNCQPSYPHMFSPSVPQQHSLPSHLHYSGPPHPQQNYWSDPFQGSLQSRTSGHLPSSHSQNGCSYKCPKYSSWGQQQPTPAAFSPERMELRKKLQAIFNPHQVDTVMEMFPHLMDAEKLAANILNLKTQGGIF